MPLLEQETVIELDEDLLLEHEAHNDSIRTHIVSPYGNEHIWKSGMDMRVLVEIAMAKGLEVKALCGYTWIPTKDPDKHDACEECMKIAGDLMAGAGE